MVPYYDFGGLEKIILCKILTSWVSWCLFTCVYMVVHIAHVVKILPRISFLMVQQLFKCCCRLWRRVVSSKVKKSFFNLPLLGIRGDIFISFEFTIKFPTGQDFLVPREEGTDDLWLSWDKGNNRKRIFFVPEQRDNGTSSKSCHGRDSLSKSGTRRRTVQFRL